MNLISLKWNFLQVFQYKDKQSYDRELSIYRQPNFKHPNILLFIANNEYPEELQLIFEYHEVGSLYDLLNKQTITTRQFCNIASSAARGEREREREREGGRERENLANVSMLLYIILDPCPPSSPFIEYCSYA